MGTMGRINNFELTISRSPAPPVNGISLGMDNVSASLFVPVNSLSSKSLIASRSSLYEM